MKKISRAIAITEYKRKLTGMEQLEFGLRCFGSISTLRRRYHGPETMTLEEVGKVFETLHFSEHERLEFINVFFK